MSRGRAGGKVTIRLKEYHKMAMSRKVLAFAFMAALLPAWTASAQNRAKLLGPPQSSWRRITCERVEKNYMLPNPQSPELQKYIGNPLEDIPEISCLPFHISHYKGPSMCFFRPHAFASTP